MKISTELREAIRSVCKTRDQRAIQQRYDEQEDAELKKYLKKHSSVVAAAQKFEREATRLHERARTLINSIGLTNVDSPWVSNREIYHNKGGVSIVRKASLKYEVIMAFLACLKSDDQPGLKNYLHELGIEWEEIATSIEFKWSNVTDDDVKEMQRITQETEERMKGVKVKSVPVKQMRHKGKVSLPKRGAKSKFGTKKVYVNLTEFMKP